ncbi:MAG TPA: hypothetical protein VNI52_13850 [Sphingobacteriaceae bacterium]|nr:hypothetical protein [Sphingobacteriaceae bacterium]
MNIIPSVVGGLAGAVAVTLLNEIVKKYDPDAPRLDLLGMSAVTKGFKKADEKVPAKKDQYKYSLVADLVSNTIFFAMAGKGSARKALTKGSLLGLTAGLGAIFAPEPLGLDAKQTNRTKKTQFMTVAYYLIGGLVAGAVGKMLTKEPQIRINPALRKPLLQK